MKKFFKTLSAILLATTCLVPGLAWANDSEPYVSLETSGALKVTDASKVHSALVEVTFTGDNAAKVTDVALEGVSRDALSSAVYDASKQKATIAVSGGDEVLKLTNGSFATLDVIAEDASVENPVYVKARVSYFEYIDSANSADPTQRGAFPNVDVEIKSTKSNAPVPAVDPPMGDPIEDPNANPDTTRAVYPKASGVVTPTQTGANTGLVKTGDVLTICGIALGAAAVVVVIALLVSRKKGAARK